jgi:hypothetical protein
VIPQIHLYSDGGLDISQCGNYILTCAILYVSPINPLNFCEKSYQGSFSPISHRERSDADDLAGMWGNMGQNTDTDTDTNFGSLVPGQGGLGGKNIRGLGHLWPSRGYTDMSEKPDIRVDTYTDKGEYLDNFNSRMNVFGNIGGGGAKLKETEHMDIGTPNFLYFHVGRFFYVKICIIFAFLYHLVIPFLSMSYTYAYRK